MFSALGASHITYCCTVYADALSKKDFLRTQSKYIECGRSILFAKNGISSESVLNSLNWLSLKNIYHYHLCVYTHKCRTVPNLNSSLLAHIPHSYHTRSANLNYFIPRISSKRSINSFTYKAAKAWNSLPDALKQIDNHESLKRSLFTHLSN